MEEKHKFFMAGRNWCWGKIKNVSSDYLRRRVLPVLPLLFVSGLARGNLGRYVVIPLRCNRRACRCLKLLTLSSASRKPSSICSLHIPLSLGTFGYDPRGSLCNAVCKCTLFFNEFVLFRNSGSSVIVERCWL